MTDPCDRGDLMRKGNEKGETSPTNSNTMMKLSQKDVPYNYYKQLS